jgi:hypothetical protein
MTTQFPIYTSHGDWVAMLVGRYIYNIRGDWIGWVDPDSHVFSARGDYAGWLSRDFRVLTRRDKTTEVVRREPPPAPPAIKLPVKVPLPPMMAELTFDTVDLFEEQQYRLDPLNMDQVEDID